MMPMMLILRTVNLVLVRTATRMARATTANSSSHRMDVDIKTFLSLLTFLPAGDMLLL